MEPHLQNCVPTSWEGFFWFCSSVGLWHCWLQSSSLLADLVAFFSQPCIRAQEKWCLHLFSTSCTEISSHFRERIHAVQVSWGSGHEDNFRQLSVGSSGSKLGQEEAQCAGTQLREKSSPFPLFLFWTWDVSQICAGGCTPTQVTPATNLPQAHILLSLKLRELLR